MGAYLMTQAKSDAVRLVRKAREQLNRNLRNSNRDTVGAKTAISQSMKAVVGAAVDHTINNLAHCSAAESAVIAGIYTQRSAELDASLPPDQGIDSKSELAKLDRLSEQLEALLREREGTSKPADTTQPVVVSPANNQSH